MTLGAGCLAAFATTAPAGAPTEDPGAKLSHQAHKKWDYLLPAERWHAVSDVITLGGLEFETETDGPLKLRVDTNADGRLDQDVKGKGGFLTLSGKNEDGNKVRYSVRIKNVAAGKWEWATGSSMSGKVAGVLVHVFDQDGNGSYDDYGVDAMTVGSTTKASLLSKVISVKGDLLTFQITEDGTSAMVEPYVGETGVLSVIDKFEAKGKLVAAVFRDGDVSFEIAGQKKGMVVPTGRYEFVTGMVEKGASSAQMRAGRMGSVEVLSGETTPVKWGETVEGEFSYRKTGDDVTVQADFAFFGAAGEEYYDFKPRGKGPKIIIKDQARGKEIKEGRFRES